MFKSRVCRYETFHGKGNANDLINALKENDYPYVVIIDGDYEFLEKNNYTHKRVIMLKKYSIENYLFEKAVLGEMCLTYAQRGDERETLENYFKKNILYIKKCLYDLVVLDVASQKYTIDQIDVLPDHPEELFVDQMGIKFDRNKLRKLKKDCEKKISSNDIYQAKKVVDRYLLSGEFHDIINGHFLFGMIRRLFYEAIVNKRGKKPNIDNKALLQMLSIEVWKQIPSKAHSNLKRRIRRAVNEVSNMIKIKNFDIEIGARDNHARK